MEENNCDCQNPNCTFGGIETLVQEELFKNAISLEKDICQVCEIGSLTNSKRSSVICKACSTGIGSFKDDINNLQSALVYLCASTKTTVYSYNLSKTKKQKIYNFLLHEQGGRCAICKIWWKDITAKNGMSIDHSHITGFIRGLLCNNCNVGLGHFKDSPKALANAINNFEKFENED